MNFTKASALALDGAMCAMMFAIQRRHRLDGTSRGALERYIAQHEAATRDAYYFLPPLAANAEVGSRKAEWRTIPAPGAPSSAFHTPHSLRWVSPLSTGFAENDRVHVDLYPCPAGWTAPTVLMLHALMSASDGGYRQWAARFNARGWNACFVHLPYHYSRTPRAHWNGELAITADCIRNAEGLRQGVVELRQLMAQLRAWGGREFGVWGSSYGGWIGGLLASVERDFRFVALLEPIVDVGHAIWTSPAGAALRRELHRAGIEPSLVARHFPLASPSHGEPLCGAKRVIFCGGEYDLIAPIDAIERLHARWRGSEMLRIPQGHFGYRIMRTAWTHLTEKGAV